MRFGTIFMLLTRDLLHHSFSKVHELFFNVIFYMNFSVMKSKISHIQIIKNPYPSPDSPIFSSQIR